MRLDGLLVSRKRLGAKQRRGPAAGAGRGRLTAAALAGSLGPARSWSASAPRGPAAPRAGNLAFPLLLVGGLFLLSRRSQGGMGGPGGNNPLAFGKSKAKFQMEPNTGITFDDVAGVDEAKQDFMEARRPPSCCCLLMCAAKGLELVAAYVCALLRAPVYVLGSNALCHTLLAVGCLQRVTRVAMPWDAGGGVPEAAGTLHSGRRTHPQGRAAGRPAWHRRALRCQGQSQCSEWLHPLWV